MVERCGFSLVELLIVLVVMGILTAALMPHFEPSQIEQLETTAQIVASDLDYARSLAVGNGSQYRVTFDATAGRYTLEHSGTNAALDTLPSSPFRRPGDPPDRHIVELDNLPHLGSDVEIAGLVAESGAAVSEVEFSEMGALTQSDAVYVWLACGQGASRRYISVEIDAVTGLASMGEVIATRPTGISR
jgi:prepilin-type N-terminal cleavage/methylation domain-containing protein